MPANGLLFAVLTAASGVTWAAFSIHAYFEPNPRAAMPIAVAASSHEKPQASLLPMTARTRFVAPDGIRTPVPKAAAGTSPKPPVVAKAPPTKDPSAPKPKRSQQAAAQWPWNLFGD